MIKLINSVFKIFKAQNKKEKYNYGRIEVRRDAEKQRKDRAEVYVDSRTVDGDRRVSQAREGASVGEQISFIDGTKGATKQIRTRSGRISDVSQLSEIYGASRENDIGRRTDSITRENNEIQRRENGSVSLSEQSDVSGKSDDSKDVLVGNRTPSIQRVDSAVRYG